MTITTCHFMSLMECVCKYGTWKEQKKSSWGMPEQEKEDCVLIFFTQQLFLFPVAASFLTNHMMLAREDAYYCKPLRFYSYGKGRSASAGSLLFLDSTKRSNMLLLLTVVMSTTQRPDSSLIFPIQSILLNFFLFCLFFKVDQRMTLKDRGKHTCLLHLFFVSGHSRYCKAQKNTTEPQRMKVRWRGLGKR